MLIGILFRVQNSVSKEMEQYNFAGQRDRSFFIVPGERDNGQAQNLAIGRAGTGCQNSARRETGQ